MAASEYSAVLGLSLWAQTDCPQWADFLQDNQKLEQKAGGHIQNAALHLTAGEKEFLSQRRAVLTYTGTGSGSAAVTLPFLPGRVTVFAQSKPPMAPRADGGWDVFSEVWAAVQAADTSQGGVSLDGETLSLQLSEGAFSGETGLYHALNRSGVSYAVVAEA